MRKLLFALGLGLMLLQTALAQPMRFVYPPPETANDERHLYYWHLLKAALEATRDKYGDYILQSHTTPMTFQRAVADVETGGERVNIVARGTNLDLEARLRLIRLPLDKGLLGYRLFLIMPQTQPQLDQVRTLEDLKRFSIGQSTPWTDVKILQAAGFRLALTANYEGLFGMLAAGRFDLFSRGVIEIDAEWRTYSAKYPGMQIEKNLILAYPLPRYFFVPRTAEGERMAARISEGLQRMVKSGEFERRYQTYKKLVLDGLPLAGRRVFRLPNTELGAGAPPLNDPVWWDDLAAELTPKKL
ncbi:MAG: hypothetical protein CGU28_09895 [Candidatus Dactylopiibacterium carminicum]|uniref:Solute-binding protein family 3/N-terminal domain-containing protein n=1 Tax=Candidatus Dactylopiibacterium carminicum TaxID=857335 RepID=A0A272ERL8_9RHOO|nr:hypothetical protein [Candidatus Dactylopiibacterium carminicum]KAF7598812.1 hypothetical protein BGI27_11165 [Candidatus Dactylopiibacterium carminicum]PAS92732.1 MAG: hypothetical protein CGU29_10485 [Candidatus Dactylopiibacterium carminicum]PAS96180.1 MAG: hypothetical protein CGU28_09895 [Candidatus Dactylopiibacterium carminicum]PAS98834.1 MAG: hypothetical protein BSR46_11185 [Candidatus Dactylopiibacterium carminicum]